MYFEDLQLNKPIKLSKTIVDKDEMISFSKRFNNIPLHTDEEYAKTTKFGQIIAPGLLTYLLVWADYVQNDFFGDELIAGKSTKIEWFKPVFAGDVLSGEAEITALSEKGKHSGIAELTIRAYNQNGDLVMSGITEAVVKKNNILEI